MKKFNSVHPWKMTEVLKLIGIALICWSTGTTFGAEKYTMQIGFTDQGRIALQIHTTPKPEYELRTINPHIHRLQIKDAGEAQIAKDASPLWNFFPLQVVKESHAENGLAMDFKISSNDSYQITAQSESSGISLHFTGELVHSTWQKAMTYASRNYKKLVPGKRKSFLAALKKMPVLPRDPFLPGLLQQAHQNQEFDWYNAVYKKIYQRQPLDQAGVENLAKYFESIGDLQFAGLEWYEYYQHEAASNSQGYTDVLPSGSNIVSDSPHPAAIGVQLLVRFRWIMLMALLGVIFTGIGWLFFHAKKPGETTLGEGSLNEAEFQDFLDEINQRLREEQQSVAQLKAAEPGEEQTKTQKTALESISPARKNQDVQTSDEHIQEGLRQYPNRRQMNEILPKQSRVLKLSQMEMAPDLIAKKLNMSRGEVELLLKIGNQSEKDNNGSFKKQRIMSEQFANATVRELSRHMHISEEEAKLIRLKRWGA